MEKKIRAKTATAEEVMRSLYGKSLYYIPAKFEGWCPLTRIAISPGEPIAPTDLGWVPKTTVEMLLVQKFDNQITYRPYARFDVQKAWDTVTAGYELTVYSQQGDQIELLPQPGTDQVIMIREGYNTTLSGKQRFEALYSKNYRFMVLQKQHKTVEI